MLILWTIQEERALKDLRKTGKLTALKFDGLPEWRSYYEWKKDEMIQKMGKPMAKEQYPLWAWVQYKNEKQRMPDLRRSGHLPSGTKGSDKISKETR